MANREYKDSFFRFIFNRPPAACSLYRAASQNPAVTEQDIRINTLDSILMDRIKNDVSLLVPGHYVVLLGHQSTWSLNLPLRCLWYISELYRHMIPNKKAMYRTKLIRIPAPQFYVFYIGSPKEPDTSVLHLSDAFLEPSDCLNLSVTVYNIAYSPHRPILRQCPLLHDYSLFVHQVEAQRKTHGLDEAIRKAMDDYAERGILSEFISTHYKEVHDMVTLWYDENEAREYWREEAFEDGMEKGILKSIQNLMHSMHLTPIEAMNALMIPPEQQKELEQLL